MRQKNSVSNKCLTPSAGTKGSRQHTVHAKVQQEHYPLLDLRLSWVDLVNKIYERSESIVICRNADEFGGLLNMHGGFPMTVNGILFRTVEALYQCCRYPNLPEVQKKIIEHTSPLMAKRYSLQFRDRGRPGWYPEKVLFMNWCLHVKLACNFETFGAVLDATGDRTIVETSPDGNFWGGIPLVKGDDASDLWGADVFGQLIERLRAEYRTKPKDEMLVVAPPAVPGALLLGEPIRTVDARSL